MNNGNLVSGVFSASIWLACLSPLLNVILATSSPLLARDCCLLFGDVQTD
jgi:hypothetical protein